MVPLSRPLCLRVADGHYHCPDIRTLYLWLESQGYHFVGSFGPEEYGRFVCQQRVLGTAEPHGHSSSISISLNGTVIAADEDAQQLLVALLTNGRLPADVNYS
jgi:hypothetical protein